MGGLSYFRTTDLPVRQFFGIIFIFDIWCKLLKLIFLGVLCTAALDEEYVSTDIFMTNNMIKFLSLRRTKNPLNIALLPTCGFVAR